MSSEKPNRGDENGNVEHQIERMGRKDVFKIRPLPRQEEELEISLLASTVRDSQRERAAVKSKVLPSESRNHQFPENGQSHLSFFQSRPSHTLQSLLRALHETNTSPPLFSSAKCQQ